MAAARVGGAVLAEGPELTVGVKTPATHIHQKRCFGLAGSLEHGAAVRRERPLLSDDHVESFAPASGARGLGVAAIRPQDAPPPGDGIPAAAVNRVRHTLAEGEQRATNGLPMKRVPPSPGSSRSGQYERGAIQAREDGVTVPCASPPPARCKSFPPSTCSMATASASTQGDYDQVNPLNDEPVGPGRCSARAGCERLQSGRSRWRQRGRPAIDAIIGPSPTPWPSRLQAGAACARPSGPQGPSLSCGSSGHPRPPWRSRSPKLGAPPGGPSTRPDRWESRQRTASGHPRLLEESTIEAHRFGAKLEAVVWPRSFRHRHRHRWHCWPQPGGAAARLAAASSIPVIASVGWGSLTTCFPAGA